MRLYGIIMAVLITHSGFAKAGAETDPRPDMHEMAKEITTLQKFVLSEADFGAPKNEARIKQSLGALQKHLEHLGKKSFGHDPALKINAQLLRSHIGDASRSFAEGSKPFARFMLQSSLQMCIACHTRHQAADFSWPEPEAAGLPKLDRADYYFATRQFSKGKAIYESLVNAQAAEGVSPWDLRRALLTLAVYYARVKEDPKGGAEYFRGVGENRKLPLYIQEECKAWAGEFADWGREAGASPVKATETELLARAKKLLRSDDFSLVSDVGRSFHVRRLRASALFHRVLESPGEKSPAKAEALLYLGQIYPKISSNLFFRFGEMYLKACVQDYQKTATARACYVALELLVTEGFTGSAGTNIPAADEAELIRLKRLAY